MKQDDQSHRVATQPPRSAETRTIEHIPEPREPAPVPPKPRDTKKD